MRRHLTFANVTSLLALSVALGGTSYAVVTIGSGQIKDNSVRGKDVRNGTLTGRDVRESALGKVPRSRRADLVGGKSAAQLTLSCPSGMRPTSGICVETGVRPAQSYTVARGQCTSARRRLVTHQELVAVLQYTDIGLAPGGELTANVYPDGTELDVLVVTSELGAATLTDNNFNGRKPFRCAADPSN